MSLWCLRVDGDGFVVLIKRGERMRAEGNYKEGNRPYVGAVIDVKDFKKAEKSYLVVSVIRIKTAPRLLNGIISCYYFFL